MKSRSRDGAVAKVWVGTTLWPMALADAGDFVVTGSKVEDMSANVTLWLHDRTFMQSTGPNTSKAWKPGNSTMPTRRGAGLP